MSIHGRPSELLFTRALGALFLEMHPALAELATRALNHAAAATAAEHPESDLQELSLDERPYERMFSTASFGPDMTLVDPGTAQVRAVLEVKLWAAWNATGYGTCVKKAPAAGTRAEEIRDYYRQHPGAARTGIGARGVFQTDAYLGWQWWEGLRYNEQPVNVAPNAPHIAFTLDGLPLHKVRQREMNAVAPEPWIPVRIYTFVNSLNALADRADGTLSSNERKMIDVLTYLCYTTASTKELTPWGWVKMLNA